MTPGSTRLALPVLLALHPQAQDFLLGVVQLQLERLELVGDFGRFSSGRDDVAAADINLVGQCDGDRLATGGLVEVFLPADDSLDGRLTT